MLQDWLRQSGFEIESLPNGSLIGTKAEVQMSDSEFHLSARQLPTGTSAQLYEIRRHLGLTMEELRARLGTETCQGA